MIVTPSYFLYLPDVSCGKELQDISAFPGEDAYEEGCKIFNQAYADIKPAFVAFPRSNQEVQRCLQCSEMHAVPCVVKSGGHSSAGYSTVTSPGYVINLAKMNAISSIGGDDVNKTVLIQAGAKWGEIYAKMSTSQLIVGGQCPSVGVAGLTLGGGYGILSRKYGLAIDSVVSMTMVTANGSEVVVANSTTNPDLFWALRGGGGGNFGIVTDITFETYSVDHEYSNYVLGKLQFEAGAKSQEALIVVGELNSELPHKLYLRISILPTKELVLQSIFFGDLDNACRHLAPIMNLEKDTTFSNFRSYYDLIRELEEMVHFASTSGLPEVQRGCIIDKVDESFVKTIFSLDIPEECPIYFMHLGGAIAEVEPTASAYYYRNGQFVFYFECHHDSEEKERLCRAFGVELFLRLGSEGHCIGNYVNTMDRDLQDWEVKYYGGNYPRLLEIKKRWNPVGSGYFHFPQEIGSI